MKKEHSPKKNKVVPPTLTMIKGSYINQAPIQLCHQCFLFQPIRSTVPVETNEWHSGTPIAVIPMSLFLNDFSPQKTIGKLAYLLMVEETRDQLTIWYGSLSTIIYRGFYTSERWLFGISEPLTVSLGLQPFQIPHFLLGVPSYINAISTIRSRRAQFWVSSGLT